MKSPDEHTLRTHRWRAASPNREAAQQSSLCTVTLVVLAGLVKQVIRKSPLTTQLFHQLAVSDLEQVTFPTWASVSSSTL